MTKKRNIKKTLLTILLGAVSASAPSLAAETNQTVGLFKNEPGAYQGYTLFTPRHYNTTYLIDMTGQRVHSWVNPSARVEYALLLDDGYLLRAARTELAEYDGLPMVHGLLQKVDWAGKVVWEFRYADETHVLHHDFRVRPNGNILAVSYDVISEAEAEAAGRDPSTIPNGGLVVDRIIEIQPDYDNGGGKIVWSWSTWDHLIQDFDSTKPNYGEIANHPERFDPNFYRSAIRDWNHVNAVDYNAELDVLLVTVHMNDEFVIIDRSTTTEEAATSAGGSHGRGGDILYRFGNPLAYQAGTTRDKRYRALHNTHWIPAGLPGAGKVMVLNNNFSGEHSILETLELPVREDGSFNWDQPPVSETVFDDFHTTNMGGGQRLPNGNTLVHEAVKGRILEVTAAQQVVWEYVIPVADEGPLWQGSEIPANPASKDLYNEFFLAYRYAPDHPALAGRTLSPQGTIERVYEFKLSDQSLELSFAAQEDVTYHLNRSDDLKTWIEVDELTATGSPATFTYPIGSQPHGFFRIQLNDT